MPLTICTTCGIRVDHPTRMISLTSSFDNLLSLRASRTRFLTVVEQVFTDLFELRLGQCDIEVARLAIDTHRDEWDSDIHSLGQRKLFLGTFCFIFDTLHRHSVITEVDTFFGFEFFQDKIDDAFIPDGTSEVSITRCREDLVDYLRFRSPSS